MGLNYRYLLYFKRERLWDALQGLGKISDYDGFTPTTVHFPDHDLVLPLMSSWGKKSDVPCDLPEYEFETSLYFEEDPAILEYLRDRDGDEFDRSPPDADQPNRYAIGFIYLTVYADLSKHDRFEKTTDMALFEFNTTGTRMSMLFEESTSIRSAFIRLLETYGGVIGILDREVDYGELIWFKGKVYEPYEKSVANVYTTPDEIEDMLRRGW